ncbi:MAG: alanine racemase, partial [Symbiobacteriaceae bacterium]
PAPCTDFEAQRRPFRALREALEALNAQLGLALDTLSMGMSDDLEAAIAEGATMVRVGTAIFGERPRPGAVPRE